jgi:hypothetical protein
MGGEKLESIGERSDFAVEAIEKRVSQATLGFFAEEIGASERADENEIAGEESGRIVASGKIGDKEREMFGSVAGGMKSFDEDAADSERSAIAEFAMRKSVLKILSLIVGAEPKIGAGAPGKIASTGSVIGMDVGLENVGDAELIVTSVVEINVHVAAGIEDHSLPLRGKYIGIMNEARDFHAMNFHEHRSRGIRRTAPRGAPLGAIVHCGKCCGRRDRRV